MKRQMKLLWQSLLETKRYVYISAIIFLVSMLMGYNWKAFHVFLEGQVAGIADIAEDILSSENPLLTLITFIFINNAVKAVAIVFLGFFLGLLPIIFLWVNGMVLGYLYLDMVVTGGEMTTWQLIVGILPHGIIELPIIVIACAYGLRLGVLVWAAIIGSKRVARGSISQFMKGTPRLVVFIVVSLFVAALIESLITPQLMRLTM